MSKNWHEVVAEGSESYLMNFEFFGIVLENFLGCREDAFHDKVRDFAHKSIDVVNSLLDLFKDPVQVEGVESHSDGFDYVLKNPHRSL